MLMVRPMPPPPPPPLDPLPQEPLLRWPLRLCGRWLAAEVPTLLAEPPLAACLAAEWLARGRATPPPAGAPACCWCGLLMESCGRGRGRQAGATPAAGEQTQAGRARGTCGARSPAAQP